jgi:hypothetical protein
MINRNKKIIEIIDERMPIFMCKECGQTWVPCYKGGSGGKSFWYGHWQCPNGCRK